MNVAFAGACSVRMAELPTVLMTPHVAGWTEGTIEARTKLIAENIRRTAAAEPPLNLIPRPVS